MLGTISVSEALALLSNEAMMCDLGSMVEDAVDAKRTSPHYQDLLDSIRRHGITTPIHIRTSRHGRFLVEGHHRVTAALDAGLPTIPWTDDPTLVDRIEALPWQLTPGTITPDAIEAFTHSACAGLAIALHDINGWPIIEVGHCDGLPLHFMVRHPDGPLVDIRGAHTDSDVYDEWEFEADGDAATLTEVTRQDVMTCYLIDCGEPVPMELARTFVPAVLTALNDEGHRPATGLVASSTDLYGLMPEETDASLSAELVTPLGPRLNWENLAYGCRRARSRHRSAVAGPPCPGPGAGGRHLLVRAGEAAGRRPLDVLARDVGEEHRDSHSRLGLGDALDRSPGPGRGVA